jgi:hypothetical protein
MFSDKVVDTRHYAFALHLTFSCIACYLVGTLTALYRSKFVILVFYVLMAIFFPEPTNTLAQYGPVILILCALIYLNLQCFKADLNAPLQSPFALTLLISGTSYGAAILLIFATVLGYHLPKSLSGDHPDVNPPEGSMRLVWKDNFEQGISYVLADSNHPQAAHYGAQASLAELGYVPFNKFRAPRQRQFHRFDYADSLYDGDTDTVWKFSHDEMVLVGINYKTGLATGVIGMRGAISTLSEVTEADRFKTVPHLSGGQFLSTETALYALDFASQSLILKHQTGVEDPYTSSLWIGPKSAIISTEKRLLIFDIATLSDNYSQLHVDYEFVLPESVKNAEQAYSFQVADGFVLLFMGENYFGFDRHGAEVFVTRLDGTFEKLGSREFTVYDHPAWIRHYNFMIAPFIFVTEEILMHSIDPYEPRFLSPAQIKAQDYPTSIYTIAIVLQLLSIAAVAYLARKQGLAAKVKHTWLSLSVVLGLPALVSYLLLNPLRKN